MGEAEHVWFFEPHILCPVLWKIVYGREKCAVLRAAHSLLWETICDRQREYAVRRTAWNAVIFSCTS